MPIQANPNYLYRVVPATATAGPLNGQTWYVLEESTDGGATWINYTDDGTLIAQYSTTPNQYNYVTSATQTNVVNAYNAVIAAKQTNPANTAIWNVGAAVAGPG